MSLFIAILLIYTLNLEWPWFCVAIWIWLFNYKRELAKERIAMADYESIIQDNLAKIAKERHYRTELIEQKIEEVFVELLAIKEKTIALETFEQAKMAKFTPLGHR